MRSLFTYIIGNSMIDRCGSVGICGSKLGCSMLQPSQDILGGQESMAQLGNALILPFWACLLGKVFIFENFLTMIFVRKVHSGGISLFFALLGIMHEKKNECVQGQLCLRAWKRMETSLPGEEILCVFFTAVSLCKSPARTVWIYDMTLYNCLPSGLDHSGTFSPRSSR